MEMKKKAFPCTKHLSMIISHENDNFNRVYNYGNRNDECCELINH